MDKYVKLYIAGIILIVILVLIGYKVVAVVVGPIRVEFEKPTPVASEVLVSDSHNNTSTTLSVTYLGQDGSQEIGSNCPGTDYLGKIIDIHLLVSGIDPQKSIERIDVIGEPGSHWAFPCEEAGGGAWGLLAVQENASEYSLYFAPVPNITQYEVTIQYTDGNTAEGGWILLDPALVITHLGEDGSKLIGSNCPGTDRLGEVVDTHLQVSGVDPQKSIDRVDVYGAPNSHWALPCEEVGGGAWGLLAVQENAGVYNLYFAPVPNITQYEVIIQYEDGSSRSGLITVPR